MVKLKDIYEFYKHEFKLNEGLIKSYPVETLISSITTKFKSNVKIDKNKPNSFYLIILPGFTDDDLSQLETVLQTYGWFISHMDIQLPMDNIVYKYIRSSVSKVLKSNRYKQVQLAIEAKYDIQVSDSRIPDELYHVTPTKLWDKIQRNGLVPKSQSKRSNHPDRVYLAKSEKDVRALAGMMNLTTIENNYVILKVDTSIIPNYFKIYKDPNFKNGYYTVNSIPPFAITKIGEIHI